MDDPFLSSAREWLDRGDRDLETAELLYDEQGYSDVIAYHIQQAVEKYLKGYLVMKGQRPPRIHELDTLLTLASRAEPDLYEPYIDLCEKATKYYIEERYPPGPPAEYSRAEIRADLDVARRLADTIKGKAGR